MTITQNIDPEVQIAADIAAAEARGEDPYADKLQASTGAAVIETDEPVEVVAEPEEVAVEQPAKEQPTAYKTSLPDDYKAQRGVLVGEKAQLMKKLMDGEMDADEFALQESRISDSLEDLTAQRIRAETLQEANTQTQAAHQQREIQKLIVKTKAEVDYSTDAKAQRQFDMALGAVGQDPDNAGKDYTELLAEAHKVVLALRGVARAPVAKATTDRPIRLGAQPPQTLSGLPTAASTGAKSVTETLSGLSGLDFEKAYDQIPKSELDRLLRS